MTDDQAALTAHVRVSLLVGSTSGDGRASGKPVWEFQHPEPSIFTPGSRLVGWAIAITRPGDDVFVAIGSAHLMVLRPSVAGRQTRYVIRGLPYIDGVMNGVTAGMDSQTFHTDRKQCLSYLTVPQEFNIGHVGSHSIVAIELVAPSVAAACAHRPGGAAYEAYLLQLQLRVMHRTPLLQAHFLQRSCNPSLLSASSSIPFVKAYVRNSMLSALSRVHKCPLQPCLL
jgi:hypothetical protein